jgi:hypothetical protein
MTSNVAPPPVRDFIIGPDGKTNLSWVLFFNNIFEGDTGALWTPTFTNLTTVGTPTITGKYLMLTRRVVYFWAKIVPATSTSSTAGTTYINNFPLTFASDGIVFAVTGNLGDGPGQIVSSNNRVYVPSWSVVTVPLTVIGIAEVTI